MRKTQESSLKEVIEQLIDNYRLRDKMNEASIAQSWELLMGAAISKRTDSITIRNGILRIKVTSAPLKQELLYQRPRILELMNRELGGNYLKEVVIE